MRLKRLTMERLPVHNTNPKCSTTARQIRSTGSHGLSANPHQEFDENEHNIPAFSCQVQVDMILIKEPSATTKFIIERFKVGLLIGKKGCNIKQIHIMQGHYSWRVIQVDW